MADDIMTRPAREPAADANADLVARAGDAAAFLKALAHEGRLLILCHLVGGERSVTELEELLGARQPFVSQQLARLRLEGLVSSRRDGRSILYRIGDPKVEKLVGVLHGIFCPAPAGAA